MLSQAPATRIDSFVSNIYWGAIILISYIGSWIEKLLKLISLNNKLQILRIYLSIYFRSCYTIIEYINVQYLVWWSRIIFWSKKASSRENIMTSSNLPLCVNKRVSPHTRKASILFYLFFLPNSRDCLELILHRHSLCLMNKCVFFLMVTMIMGTR